MDRYIVLDGEEIFDTLTNKHYSIYSILEFLEKKDAQIALLKERLDNEKVSISRQYKQSR